MSNPNKPNRTDPTHVNDSKGSNPNNPARSPTGVRRPPPSPSPPKPKK